MSEASFDRSLLDLHFCFLPLKTVTAGFSCHFSAEKTQRRFFSSCLDLLFSQSYFCLLCQQLLYRILITSSDARTPYIWGQHQEGSSTPHWRRSASASETNLDTWRCMTQKIGSQFTQLIPSKKLRAAPVWITLGCMNHRSDLDMYTS